MEAKRRKVNRKSVPTKLQNGSRAGSVIMLEMDTTAPISDLQKMIGAKLNSKGLSNYEIYLQDIKLNPRLSIYDQAIRVSGSVELKVQVETDDNGGGGRLTIVEVAKNMTDDEIRALGGEVNGSDDNSPPRDKNKSAGRVVETEEDEELSIPSDPTLWTQEEVHSWMLRIAKGYNLDPLLIKKPGMDGKRFCALPIEDFFIKFPYGNIFWSHLTFLRKLACPSFNDGVEVNADSENDTALNLVVNDRQNKAPASGDQETVTIHITEDSATEQSSSMNRSNISTGTKASFSSTGTRSHSSAPGGQIQLWQFLLELLTDADERNVITWVGDDGGFKFLDPERVAQKWGERKGKPAMNYEKLSRALRYYYDGEMISKVAGKRFEYKFVCNLKEILGFNAAELHAMVAECYEKRRAERTATVKAFGAVTGVIENGTYFAR